LTFGSLSFHPLRLRFAFISSFSVSFRFHFTHFAFVSLSFHLLRLGLTPFGPPPPQTLEAGKVHFWAVPLFTSADHVGLLRVELETVSGRVRLLLDHTMRWPLPMDAGTSGDSNTTFMCGTCAHTMRGGGVQSATDQPTLQVGGCSRSKHAVHVYKKPPCTNRVIHRERYDAHDAAQRGD
jgi:hypothetical protein